MTRQRNLLGISFLLFGILVCAAPAAATQAGWQREYARQQGEILRLRREGQLGALRHSTRCAEEDLRLWYQSRRDALRADFDRARRHLRGRAWSEYVRRYGEAMADLARRYAEQRRLLTQDKLAAERGTRDYYRHLERRIEDWHDPRYYGHAGHHHGASVVPPLVPGRPCPQAGPSFSLDLPWFGLSIR